MFTSGFHLPVIETIIMYQKKQLYSSIFQLSQMLNEKYESGINYSYAARSRNENPQTVRVYSYNCCRAVPFICVFLVEEIELLLELRASKTNAIYIKSTNIIRICMVR